ncbi:hypothetical protein [Streptomyces spiralis]
MFVELSGHERAGLAFGADGEDTGDGLLLYTPDRIIGFGLADTIAPHTVALGTPTGAHLGHTLTP